MNSSSGSIHREIRQGKPFRSQALAVVLSMVRTVDDLKGLADKVVRSHGITIQQFNVLRILQGAGEDGLPTLEIRERMVERSPGITGLVDRLEDKGLVTRERGIEDRRQVHCRITTDAIALLSSLDGPMAAVEDAAMVKLKPDELAQLLGMLDRIRMGVEEQVKKAQRG
ncbi:MAG: MarR family winged helix-turn-helix transcriptional regulator [Gemmatimonadales bacterium]